MKLLTSAFSTRVGQRLLLSLLIASLTITMTTLAWILALDYNQGKTNVTNNLSRLEESYRSSLAISLWNFDEQQLMAQMQGFLNFEGIEYVVLRSKDFGDLESGTPLTEPDFDYQFDLIHSNASQSIHLGKIEIQGSFAHVRQTVLKHGVQLAAVQLITTLVIAIVLMLLIHLHITRHLQHLGNWARSFSIARPDNKPYLRRNRRKGRKDELDTLVEAFEWMQQTIVSDTTQQEIATQALSYTHEQLNMAIENTELGYGKYRVKEGKLEINRNFCQQLRITQSELDQLENPLHRILERIQGDQAETQRERIYQLLQGRVRRVRGDFRVLKFNGQDGYLEISFHAFSFHNNQPEEVIICCSDRTSEMNGRIQLQELSARMEASLRSQREDFQHELLEKTNKLNRVEREQARVSQRLASLQHRRIFETLEALLNSASEAVIQCRQCDNNSQNQAHQLTLAHRALALIASADQQPFDLVLHIRKQLEQALGNELVKVRSQFPRTLIITSNAAVIDYILDQLVVYPAQQLGLKAEQLSLGLELQDQLLIMRLAWQDDSHHLDTLFPFPSRELCADLSEMELRGNLQFEEANGLLSAVITIDLDG